MVDAKYAELPAAGYQGRHEPWEMHPGGMHYAAVADPDGKGVDLYTGLTPRLREEYR